MYSLLQNTYVLLNIFAYKVKVKTRRLLQVYSSVIIHRKAQFKLLLPEKGGITCIKPMGMKKTNGKEKYGIVLCIKYFNATNFQYINIYLKE